MVREPAPVSRAAATSGPLYDRLGGAARIAEIVEEALDRHAVNPVLAPRLRGTDLPTLSRAGTRLACAGLGGPSPAGEELGLRAACARLGVSEVEYRASIDDVLAALASHGVGQAEAGEVLAVLHALREATAPRCQPGLPSPTEGRGSCARRSAR